MQHFRLVTPLDILGANGRLPLQILYDLIFTEIINSFTEKLRYKDSPFMEKKEKDSFEPNPSITEELIINLIINY
ncbi:MAG: hypothetical protein F6K40_22700 [Okeania sp. SIO3I5]|uniref:hypothetical protein n=1 Tax=Okeania sp. SIO3I5 TaxID=2607805 RepID=UPI0013BD5B87|nr:hypothetical protein [Okeania sp. SIO3I5]NEQ38929.1 hypothetical protein [Okeania sp. SIO3I5]